MAACALAWVACAPTRPSATTDQTAHDRARESIVVLMDRAGRPHCSGTIVHAHGRIEILTAAHCVQDQERVQYVTRSEWYASGSGFAVARVVRNDCLELDWSNRCSRGLDRAWLVPDVADPRTDALAIGALTDLRVSTVSAYAEWDSRDGAIVGAAHAYGWTWYADLAIVRGWSGSPVLSAGRVIGVLSACETKPGLDSQCAPGGLALVVRAVD